MGATLAPAIKEDNVLRHTIDAGTFEDPDFGTMSNYNPFEVHLSYSTIMTLLDYMGYEVGSDDYCGSYELGDFEQRLYDAIAAFYSDDEPPMAEDEILFDRWMPALLRVVLGANRSGATHVVWS